MPKWMSPLQQTRWDRAKEIVREQTGKPQSRFSDQDWGLTMHIMQNMKWYPDEPPKKRRKKRSADCTTHPGIPESAVPAQTLDNLSAEGCQNYDDSHDVCLDNVVAALPNWKMAFENLAARKCR